MTPTAWPRSPTQCASLRVQACRPQGRFTNSRIWDEYGVRAPNWGYVYDRTVHDLAKTLSLAPYAEPKIEPEIIVGLCAVPSPGMDDAALLSCIGWVAHGAKPLRAGAYRRAPTACASPRALPSLAPMV